MSKKKDGKAKKKDREQEPVSQEGLYPGPDVEIDGVHIDLDLPELPKIIKERAFTSGGFPYDEKLDDEAYEKELLGLQIELQKMHRWVREKGERVVVVFEGRDSAGKGGAIHRLTQHLNPRTARVVALPKPTEAERGEWYFQRYVDHLPTRGEIVIFDRSWYNRAGVEPVMGFCTQEETEAFLEAVPVFENMLTKDGIRLIKIWLTIGREMQVKRLFDRRHDPLKQWKLSPIDYEGLPKWDAFTEAARLMLARSHTHHAHWTVIRANDKRRARIEAVRTVLARLDYGGKDHKAVGHHDGKLVAPADVYLASGAEP